MKLIFKKGDEAKFAVIFKKGKFHFLITDEDAFDYHVETAIAGGGEIYLGSEEGKKANHFQ